MTVGGKPPLNSKRPLVESGILYPETDKIDFKKKGAHRDDKLQTR